MKLSGGTHILPPRQPNAPYRTHELSSYRKTKKDAAKKNAAKKNAAEKAKPNGEAADAERRATTGRFHGADGPGAYPEEFEKAREEARRRWRT